MGDPATLSRFRLERVLGRGGTGTVYEAYDPTNDSVVALKVIDSQVAEDVYRLKHEFRSLADLQHENLVRFGELACEAGQWFFTMELVRGQSFTEYVRPLGRDATRARPDPEGPSGTYQKAAGPGRAARYDDARLRDALDQLLAAVSVIHENGRTHCDIKPSNVLVSDEGRVVLLDFGLMATLGTSTAANGDIFGTPAFMAPEQVEAEDVNPASDVYAVGAMLFLALTGVLPFGGTVLEIMASKVAFEAPAPASLVPEVPADLDALCSDMLRMDPAARPGLAEIRRRLRPGAFGDWSIAREGTGPGGSERAPPFVGRESELRRLTDIFEETARGLAARLVVVEGEPGMGKSTLVHRFLSVVGERALVLSGRCYEQETVPFKGIDGIVDALSEYLLGLVDTEVEEVIGGGVRYLATVFPVLNRVPAIERTGAGSRTVGNPMTLREQAFGELERLVAALSSRRPLILTLDDLQWADDDSVVLLERLLRSSYERSCLFLATLRTGADLTSRASALVAGADRIALAGLSEVESNALLDALQTARRGSEGRAELVREAEGHPLFLVELLRSERAGRARRGDTLLDVLWRRVHERDPIERRFLELLAVAGTPTRYDLIAKAAELDVGECQTRLGSLRAAQLIRVTRKGDKGEHRVVETYHDRLREAIVLRLQRGAAGGAPLAREYLRLARATLSSTPPAELPEHVFAIVQHFDAASSLVTDEGERRRVAELHLLAAHEAQLATAHTRARDLAARGLAFLRESAWSDAYVLTRDLHCEVMVAEFSTGGYARAKVLFDEVRARLRSEGEKTELTLTRIHLETNLGNYEEAVAVSRERVRELGFEMPPAAKVGKATLVKLYAAARLAQRRRAPGDFLHLRAMEDRAIEAIVRVLLATTTAAYVVKNELWAWISLTNARFSMRCGVADTSAFAAYGSILAAFGNHAEGVAFCEVALALTERFPAQRSVAEVWLFAGSALHWARPLDEAIAMLRTGLEHAKREGNALYESSCASILAGCVFSQGRDLGALRETTEWCAETCRRRRNEEMWISVAAFPAYAAILLATTEGGGEERYVPIPSHASNAVEAVEAVEAPNARSPQRLVFNLYLCNAELGYLFEDFAGGASWLAKAKAHVAQALVLSTAADLCLLEVLFAAKAHETQTFRDQLGSKWLVRQCVGKLRVWAQSCPANFEPSYLIARGEQARMAGDLQGAEDLFARAALSARIHKMPKREAMARELASRAAEAQGESERAGTRRAEAIAAYERWGGVAKARRLRRDRDSD